MLRSDYQRNYYSEFDIVPVKYRPMMQKGKVPVTNWQTFNPRSEHEECGKSYAVANKGPDTPETFARCVLGDLYDKMPVKACRLYFPEPGATFLANAGIEAVASLAGGASGKFNEFES